MRVRHAETQLSVEVHVPHRPPPDPAAWATELAGAPGLALERTETERGWPMFVARAGDRTVALYHFLDDVAALIVRGDAGEARALAATARPSWRPDDVVTLNDLWEPPAE